MLPPTYAVMSTVRIDNADTAHPSLQISLPESFFIASQRSHSCQAAVLMKWPPEAFLDPFTFPFSSDDLIDSVESLNGTSSHRDFTRVELEKSTGYSLDRETRTLAAQCADEKLRRSYLEEEYTASLLYLKDNLSLAISPNTIRIPFHTRYPLPVVTNDFFSWEKLSHSLVWPSSSQGYASVAIPHPEALWVCEGQGLMAVDSSVFDSTCELHAEAKNTAYFCTTAFWDVLSPSHLHLNLAAKFEHGEKQNFRLRHTLDTPFTLRLPAAQQKYAPFVHVATFLSLFLAALFTIARVHVLVSQTGQKKAAH